MKTATILSCCVALFLSNGCSLFYVLKQGIYQMSLLSGAEPIELALRTPDLDANKRKKLELILDVRHFAENELKLEAKKNYKDVNLSWDQRIHTISGSAALKFRPYLWWFPVVGNVPYKGFFNETDADLEKKLVEAQGFETQKREIHGYSTLGYFSDPVWPAMLLMSEQALVELIIHELAHATVYIPNQTPFNETFASFVGKHGARAYIVHRFGKNSDAVTIWDRIDQNEKRYHQFFHELYATLNNLYGQEMTDHEKRAKKAIIYAEAKKDYETLVRENKLPSIDFNNVNNAYLLSFKSYNEDFHVFDKLMSLVGGDFGKFIDEINYYGRTTTPFLSLRDRVENLETKKWKAFRGSLGHN
jgi:predicted aminopeptidase